VVSIGAVGHAELTLSDRLDQLTPNAANGRALNGANGSVKRKADFSSPATPRVGKVTRNESPMGTKTPGSAVNGDAGVDGIKYVIPWLNRGREY